MTKRKVKAAPRRATWTPWEDQYRVYFSLAGKDFTPPAKLRLTPSRDGMTISGRFTLAGGNVVQLATRLAIPASGPGWIAKQSLRIRVQVAP